MKFSPPTESWFQDTFETPTQVQQRGWESIRSGAHSLLIAPTGSGKTLAAFLAVIDRLCGEAPTHKGARVLYVSPLKALAHDIERNLRRPLAGIANAARSAGQSIYHPTIDIRTGDTSAKQRRVQLRSPADILVTTPESLYLLLGSKARENLRTIEVVIIDEIHALAPTKRGSHLALSLERLSRTAHRDPLRIGLSATARPLEDVAKFLGGDRQVNIVDCSRRPALNLSITVTAQDMTAPPASANGPGLRGLWPSIHDRLLKLIRAHETTIVFVNSRGLCERLCQSLNDLAGETVLYTHHGSVSQERRREVETALSDGTIAGIVATSSLELGIDMDSVDLVVLVESPLSVASGLQRAGRAGHQAGATSRAVMMPKHRGDLLESTALAELMLGGELEPLAIPQNCLDVLAQQLVAEVATETITADELYALVRRASSYCDLPRQAYDRVLDMLSGNFPSTALAHLKARMTWSRQTGALTPTAGAKMIATLSGGTIPDRGLYRVEMATTGSRVGELDEEMVHESSPGDVFMLGTSSWRIDSITRDKVLVTPAPGELGKLPFWHGDSRNRSVMAGQRVGALCRELLERDRHQGIDWLRSVHHADDHAARNLVDYVRAQRDATGAAPTDRTIIIERFRDEMGDWRVCVLTPWGGRVHAPWALAVRARLQSQTGYGAGPKVLWTNDGIVFQFGDEEVAPSAESLLPHADDVTERVIDAVSDSPMFAAQFRENAARALLMPRRRPGGRSPLWLQRIRGEQLLSAALEHPDFPVLVETYRSCLRDVFDLPALERITRDISTGAIEIRDVTTIRPSPFAQSLLFAYVGQHIYNGDAPAAERRAITLALDRDLLKQLLGTVDLSAALDDASIDAAVAERQRLTRPANSEDSLAELLRQVGDLSAGELRDRVDSDPRIQALVREGRATTVTVAGEIRWIAAEDAGLYAALGFPPMEPVAPAFMGAPARPAVELIRRFANTHGPFGENDISARYGQLPGIAAATQHLAETGELVHGRLRRGHGAEYCGDGTLRHIKGKAMAALREQSAPVAAAKYAGWLGRWQGIGNGERTLEQVIETLEGHPFAFDDLERRILPARLPRFRKQDLDQLGASGWLCWFGHNGVPGTVVMCRRNTLSAWHTCSDESTLSEHATLVLLHLREHGACFWVSLSSDIELGEADIEKALWELVWIGHVTNDTFQPVRLRRSRSKRNRPVIAGRWSAVDPGRAIEPTEGAILRTQTLLDRYGILSRETVQGEPLAGNFGTLYPVLRAMEESGRVQRGAFVEGLSGAQFGITAAVDQLRARALSDTRLLAATDSANPYGSALPWPKADHGGHPRRVAGASVVLCDGVLVLFVDRGNKRIVCFVDDGVLIETAASALSELSRTTRRAVRVQTINGTAAREWKYKGAFIRAGFEPDHRGLSLE